jgi:hypothetical protein
MRLAEVPDSCPKCGHNFSRLLQKPRWQRMAVLIMVLGCAVTVPWMGVIMYVWLNKNEFFPDLHLQRSKGVMWLGLAPGLLAGLVAYSMRHVIPLRCRKCGWSMKCLIDKPQYRTKDSQDLDPPFLH